MSDHEDHIKDKANRARVAAGKSELNIDQYRAQVELHKSTARSDLLHDYLVDVVD